MRRKARDMAWREPIWVGWDGVWLYVGAAEVDGGRVIEEPLVAVVEGGRGSLFANSFAGRGNVVGRAGGSVCER